MFVTFFFSGMLFVIRWAHAECARMAGEQPDRYFIAILGFVAWAFLATAALSGILTFVGVPHPEIFGSLSVALCYGVYGFRRDKRWIQRTMPTLGRARE
jgi:TRAP-type mannitol/chloroaromatic compound transport system permease small subunit